MRIVLADDAALFREGVANLLREAGFDVVGQAENADALMALVGEHQPDVAIIDIRMPPTHTLEGLEAAKIIRARYPAVGVLVLSQFVEPHYALQLINNAEQRAGYLLKDRVEDIEELADAVRQIASGRLIIDPAVVSQLLNRSRRRDPVDALTDREKAVLALMAQGRSNHAIAKGLFVTEKTVEAHIRAIFIKLNLSPTADDHRRVLAVITYLSEA
jgi:DNA-binding NarL/FixJ family response regulator